MKFRTTDLIERIDNLLRDLEGKALARAEEHDEKLEASKQEWLDTNGDGFRSFVKIIVNRLSVGEPITIDDIPDSIRKYGDLKVYYPPSNGRPLAEERKHENLLKLKAALQASQEDTVSPTAIKQLGFQDVTFLFTPEASK